MEAQGAWAPVWYTLFLSAWIASAVLPCSVVEVVPAYLFGFTTGFAVSLVGKVIGALLSLALARALLRERLRSWVAAGHPRMATLSAAVEEEGVYVLVLVRLSYVPIAAKNYIIPALVDLPAQTIMLAALVAGTPFSLLWAAVGSTSRSLQDILGGERSVRDLLPEDDAARAALALAGVAAVVAVVAVARKVGKRVHDKMLAIEARKAN